MKDMAEDMTALEPDAAAFFEVLEDQQARIADHTLRAWDGETLDEVNDNLKAAKAILNRIADTAYSSGFSSLGGAAAACAGEVTAHLEGPDADLAICPGEIVHYMDLFVAQCEAAITA